MRIKRLPKVNLVLCIKKGDFIFRPLSTGVKNVTPYILKKVTNR